MYRFYITFLFFTLALGCFSQTNFTTNAIAANSIAASSFFSGFKVNDYGHANSRNGENIEGSPYLFKNWNNLSKIWYGDTVLKLDSVNYNIENERFEIKLNKDSIFIISPDNNLKKVEINFVVFKPYNNQELNTNSFYQVLWDGDNYSLLSKYKLKIKGGGVDPLTKNYVTPKEYTFEKDYFLLEHNEQEQMVPIKLKKSDILNLIEDSYVDQVKSFAKKRKLKYKEISDVEKILTYYYSIKS